ncbi:hypothetical protein BED35_12550 [Yersinia enterocolitica]|nr:hypothetical protein BED34_12080 [Yersinia enterocolitica]AOF23759.1 hypothetical protein BED33_14775 [Yersinia enterocolitica]AOF27400.1 hypothetical protein BED32_11695 [Yersinia enterocolitica]AOF31576.1 hypothetical protein BED35_12550 [Yersinia enterocolitica]AOF35497.1 hypothetical protein BFS78_11635 [Yersinia enterocolitica]
MQKGHQIGSLKICYVMPALAGVGFNRFTTFGWILFHNDWINQSSTHANVESKKPRRLTEASNFTDLSASMVGVPDLSRSDQLGGICELGAAAYSLTHRSFAFCSRAYMKYTLSLLIFK